MSDFREFLAQRFAGDDLVELSSSNNLVYLVTGPAGRLVAKHVTDVDIPLPYLAEANRRLAMAIPVQRITEILDTEQGDPFDAVFAEYVEGESLADVLQRPDRALSDADLADYLCRYLLACRDLPRMRGGFGLYKRSAVVDASHPEFATRHAARYWSRVRPYFDGSEIGAAVDEWLASGLARALAVHPVEYDVVPIDANLRNFVVATDARRIVVLNVPIVAYSTPAHAVAAVSVHLRHRPLHAAFLAAARRTVCPTDAAMVPHFELWQSLGVLSFYAVREPDRPATWRNWGSPVPLYEDFSEMVHELLLGKERP
jgi:hypothetical protein